MSAIALDFEEGQSVADMREADFLKPGIYHVVVQDVEDLINEQSQDVYGFALTLQVVAGNVAGQEKKIIKHRFNLPSPGHKDGGEFCKKALKVLCQASGLVVPGQAGRKQIEFSQLVDMQFVVGVKLRKYKDQGGNEKETTEIDGLKMWHIDEPDVANVPKNATMIENCVGCRWTPEVIAIATAKNGNGHGGGQAAATAGAGAAAPAKQDWGSI